MSANTVAEIMAELGLQGRKLPKRRSLIRQGKREADRDLVGRCFDVVVPNLVGLCRPIHVWRVRVFLRG